MLQLQIHELSLTMTCKPMQLTDIIARHHIQVSQCIKGTWHVHTDPYGRLGGDCSDFMAALYKTPNVKGNEVTVPQKKHEIVNTVKPLVNELLGD
jgi:hypothetical protein